MTKTQTMTLKLRIIHINNFNNQYIKNRSFKISLKYTKPKQLCTTNCILLNGT